MRPAARRCGTGRRALLRDPRPAAGGAGGRSTAVDGTPGQEAAIVNERFAALFLADVDPIGALIRVAGADGDPSPGAWLRVIGVAPSVRQSSQDGIQPDPVVYLPVALRGSAHCRSPRPHQRRSGDAHRVGSYRTAPARSATPARSGDDHDGGAAAGAVDRPNLARVAERHRHDRAAAGARRPVRGDGAFRAAATEGAGHPAGAGSDAAGRRSARAPAGPGAAGDRAASSASARRSRSIGSSSPRRFASSIRWSCCRPSRPWSPSG